MQKYNSSKNALNLKKKKKKTKILQDIYYYNSIITNLKFQQKPKYHLLIINKSSYNKNKPIIIITKGGQNPLKLLYSYNESKTQYILALVVVVKANIHELGYVLCVHSCFCTWVF